MGCDSQGIVSGPVTARIESRYRVLLGLICAVGVGMSLLQIRAGSVTWRGVDDAFISYRYAAHIAEGLGPVYNPGEERVEGYSNPLYVVMLVPGAALFGRDGVYGASVILNLAACAGCIFVTAQTMKRGFGRAEALVAAGLLAGFPALWAAVSSGLETPFVLLLQILLVKAVVDGQAARRPGRRDLWALAVIVSLSVLMRADGFIAPGLAVIYLLMQGRYTESKWAAASLVITLMILTGWRLAYYGYALPNTFYAKVAGSLGERFRSALDQVFEISFALAMFPSLAVIGMALNLALVRVIQSPRRIREYVSFELVLALGLIGYWFSIGGDLYNERFLMIVPVLAVAMLFRVRLVDASRWQVRMAVLPFFVAGFALLWIGDGRFDYTADTHDGWATLGQFLASEHEGEVIAVDAAGKIPYYSGLQTIDMYGLNDGTIGHRDMEQFGLVGHSKFDPDYVFDRRPDLIAAWLLPDLGLGSGISRARYEALGYRLHYIVYMPSDLKGAPIIDVSTMDEEAIVDLFLAGYQYGVIELQADEWWYGIVIE